jgi:molybdopterin molybdotransferase
MIAYSDALEMIRAEVPPAAVETVSAGQARGRFVARTLRSPSVLPPFRNSAMDGFAMRTEGRRIEAGSRWRLAGEVAAGDPPSNPAALDGRAWEIMTGAPVPDGLDTVVPVERTERLQEEGDTLIQVLDPLEPGSNIRPAGKDFAEGDPVLGVGDRVGPAQVMALAALGIHELPVFRRPRALVLSTGEELVDDPGVALRPGAIRNSNGPFLAAALEGGGVEVTGRETLGDDPGAFAARVQAALDDGLELVVSTGAVSMGRYDFVPRALETLGARLLFHRVAIRPGKPVLAAVLPGGALFFGLPGNPMSAAAGLRFFVHPVLRRLTGRGGERPLHLPLRSAVAKRPELRYFTRARIHLGEDGPLEVEVLAGQQSFRIAPFLSADAWAVLPEGMDEVEAGQRIQVFGLLGELFTCT